MCDNDTVFENGLSITQILECFNELGKSSFINEKIGVLQKSFLDEYKEKYDLCDSINGVTEYKGLTQQKTTELKGLVLEQLVRILLEGTGQYYTVHCNLMTSSNEIDLLVSLNEKGRAIRYLIDDKYHKMICECKNHSKGLKVDYVGKFYSLIRYTHLKFAIIFTWRGLTGNKSWNESSGLLKKIFLVTDTENKPVYIIDFNKADFKKVLEGESLFSILDSKCLELEMDIDFESNIKKHENEEKINIIINTIDDLKKE